MPAGALLWGLALSPWCEASKIRAAGGTSGIDANAATDPDAARPIVLYPDGDPSAGAWRLSAALPAKIRLPC